MNTNLKEPNDEIRRLLTKHRLTKENKKKKIKNKKKIKYITNKMIKYNLSNYPYRCLLMLDNFANYPLLKHN